MKKKKCVLMLYTYNPIIDVVNNLSCLIYDSCFQSIFINGTNNDAIQIFLGKNKFVFIDHIIFYFKIVII